jgi:hypothetical protein
MGSKHSACAMVKSKYAQASLKGSALLYITIWPADAHHCKVAINKRVHLKVFQKG